MQDLFKNMRRVNFRYAWLNEEGEIVECHDLEAFTQWVDAGGPIIKQEDIGGIFLSTVFLYLSAGMLFMNCSLFPWPFETMVFDGPLHQAVSRSATKAEALEAHEAMKVLVIESLPLWRRIAW